MKLPNIEHAEVAEAKIREYLLHLTHPTGRSKAAFFSAFGFSPSAWESMKSALLAHAHANEVTAVDAMPGGTHYVVEGPFPCPDGRTPLVRVVWRVDQGSTIPRFITAYPGG